jgi:acetylornithine deacetylase/succinyl-diaminopimelate desuccinylase-like protein
VRSFAISAAQDDDYGKGGAIEPNSAGGSGEPPLSFRLGMTTIFAHTNISPMREDHLEDFYSFLRFPSVSTDPTCSEKVTDCANWLVGKLTKIGLSAKLHLTAGHPVVWAHNKQQSSRHTVLIYGHYDVQPPDPLDLWDSPPFEPVLKNGYVFARGATDNKGQIFSHILGVQEQLEAGGELPVNLHFVIEGEEEIGSGHLGPFLSENRDVLKCDVVVVSDTGMIARGVPTISYSLRGVTALELKITGAKMDLHSGIYGGAVANPLAAMARLLATLHDANGHIAIPGFYDDVRPLESWEREMWKKIPVNADEEILKETGVPELFGEKGFSTLERIWARPTAEINGFGGGYQGRGTKTVIAREASAKLTFRLVPNQNGEKIVALAQEHFRRNCPPGVKLEMKAGHSGPWYFTDPQSKYGQAAQCALKQAFGREPVLIREGGSIPITSDFRNILGVETLLIGLALPDCRAHSPNENFPLENLDAGIRINKAVLKEIAA